MKRICFCLIVFLTSCLNASAATKLAPVQAGPGEYPYLPYRLTGEIFQLPKVWKFQEGDNAAYSGAEFDDSQWKTLEVGKARGGGPWRWYRTAFDLPPSLEGRDLLLNLGAISVTDEVFLNGVVVGKYGGTFPNILRGASDVQRKYPIVAERFRPGRNVIAIRVYLGHKGGLYQGPFTLQALNQDAVLSKLSLKTEGPDALETLLYPAPVVMSYAPGSPVLVEPNLMQLTGTPRPGELAASIVDDKNATIARDSIALSLNAYQWSRVLFRFNAPHQTGDYECRLSFIVDGKNAWTESVPLQVKEKKPILFQPKVDAKLAQLNDEAFPVQVSSYAMGHFGPREVNEKLELYDNLQETDARSGLAYSVQFGKAIGAPRLFLSNARPVPLKPNGIEKFHRAAGHQYDGLGSAWIYGFVRPNRAGALANLAVKNTSWARRTYRYEYASKDWMDFSISALSPAWQLASNAQKVRVFDESLAHGVGLPTRLAYESNGQVKIVDAKKGIQGRDMSANWVLAWFNGALGWDEFDTPYLFVLQKRPSLVQCYADAALFFNYPDTAGIVQGMPLFGVTLQQPGRTASWATGIPADVAQRCRYWSKVLVNAPQEVKRTARVDYAANQLVVKDEFTYLDLQDDWKTAGLKIAPVSPILSLSAAAGNIDIAVSRPTADLQMATLQGPLVAADNAEKILFRVTGLLPYLAEIREVTPAQNSATAVVREQLNQIVAGGLKKELSKHPWVMTVNDGKVVPGLLRLHYTNLILALPYLEPALRAAVEKEIQVETEKYLLNDGPVGPELAPKLREDLRERPLVVYMTNPVSGQKLGFTPAATKGFGIDQTYFTALNIYMAWFYAHTFDRYDWLKSKSNILNAYFNVTRNSHDWDTGVSWDTLSGFRVGNGLQESGGIYAGMVGLSRIARKLGDGPTADAAAYYAVMQAVGLQGQLAAGDYLRERRPWLGSNTKSEDIEYVQRIRPYYFAEYNEFAGLSQAIIGHRNSASSPGGFIESPLPEVMRLYREIWPKFTNEFYNPKYDKITTTDRRIDSRISLDAFVYQITDYPQTVQQVFDVRKDLEIDWWEKLPDYRAYLDAQGTIAYRKLW